MLEEEIEFVKVDTLKPRLGNENVTAKVVDIGESRSVTSRRDYSVRAHESFWYRPARRPFRRRRRY